MREIISLSGAGWRESFIKIKFDLEGELKELIQSLLDEGFKIWVDSEGYLVGELEGSYEEICRIAELLKIKGFKL